MEEKGNRIKNKSSLITGLLVGIVSVAFLPELFQALLALIFDFEFNFELFLIFPQIAISSFRPDDVVFNLIVRFAPFIFLLLSCEVGAYLLRPTYPGFYRYTLLMYILTNVGYMLFYVFLNSIVVILNIELLTDWSSFLILLEVDHIGSLIYIFPLIIVLAVYLNFITKRILKYVNF